MYQFKPKHVVIASAAKQSAVIARHVAISSVLFRFSIVLLKKPKPNLETAETLADCFAALAMTICFGWV
jgi:hypothetical protein